MADDLPVTAYATPRLIAAALAAGAALTGVARWFMRPPPDNDRGLKDPDVQRLIVAERRRVLQQRRELEEDMAHLQRRRKELAARGTRTVREALIFVEKRADALRGWAMIHREVFCKAKSGVDGIG